MTRIEKALVHGSTWGVAGSGFVYGWMRYCLSHEDPYTALNHPWQPAALAWHVVMAPLLVFAVGLIAQEHILSRMKEGARLPGRVSGLAAASVVVPMVLSGYALQVVSSPGLRAAALWVHLGSSGVFFLTYLVHAAMSRRPARPRPVERDGIISQPAWPEEGRARP